MKHDNRDMPKKPQERPSFAPTFARQWRKYLKLTQIEVANRMEIEQGTLSRIESGKAPYNQMTLEAIAHALGVDVADIISVNPLLPDPPRLVYNRLRSAPPAIQKQALAIIEALLNAA